MSALAHPLVTVEEYLAFDDATPGRHEYYRGYILAMAGGTYRHGHVSANVIVALGNAIDGKPCSVLTSDVRLAVDLDSHYTYPDAMVVCGEPVFTTLGAHTVRNPIVIVEVLSPSTERADRGRKFTDYRKLESLREYLLVSPTERRVERYRRQPGGAWVLHEFVDETGLIRLESLECDLRMADIYKRVSFEPEAEADLADAEK